MVRRDRDEKFLFVEKLRRTAVNAFAIGGVQLSTQKPIFHFGIEVKTGEKGEGAPGRSAIEEAATQVSRGLNGLINFFMRDVKLMEGVDSLSILPVLFTTANLFTSDIDLSETDLKTGNFPREKANLSQADWLIYQYHLSPGLKHENQAQPASSDLVQALESEFIRSIIVVSPAGIADALKWATQLTAG